ncbi:hypothetical protein A7X12_06835 [Sphingomonas sp. TDK1]|nr:hypothetical protein A7X12_06835 [Sphingomonas sp. TDK1]
MEFHTSFVPGKVSRDRPVASAQAVLRAAAPDPAGAPVAHALLEDATAIRIALQAFENWSGRQDPESSREARMAFETLKQGCARLAERLRQHHPG